jgi:hypothetical protein
MLLELLKISHKYLLKGCTVTRFVTSGEGVGVGVVLGVRRGTDNLECLRFFGKRGTDDFECLRIFG